MSWQYKFGSGSLLSGVAAGIESHTLTLQSRGIDQATLIALPSVSPAYGSTIELWYGGVRKFLGRVQTCRLVRSGTSKRMQISLVGPQWWLTRINYHQQWSIYYGGAVGPQPSSRVILNQDSSGNNISVESQIHSIVDFAHNAGAPIQYGLASVSLTLPFDEQRDLSCHQAIERVLRYAPDVCSWTDYSATTPTIYFGQGSQISIPSTVESDDVVARNDLVVPGLTVQIERICTVNNAQFRTLQTLVAGNTSAPEAIFATLTMAGSEVNQTFLTCAVVSAPIPTVNQAAVWWQANHPRLANILPADISFSSNQRLVDGSAAPDTINYPNVSVTSISDLTSLGLHARVEQWVAVANLIQRDTSGNIIGVETGVSLTLDVITTDATTQTYKIMQSESLTGGEPCPSDLATALWAHWSVLYSQGNATWPVADLWPVPGQLYTTNSPIQVIRIESQRHTVDVEFGPPQHLEISDWATRLQGFRTRRPTYSWSMRTSTGSQQGGSLGSNPITPAKSGGSSPGTKNRETLEATSSEGLQQQINLNPACVVHSVPGDRVSRSLQPREVWIPYQSGTTWMAKMCQVLCSELYDTGVALGGGSATNPGTAEDTFGSPSMGAEGQSAQSDWVAGGTNGLVIWIETRQRYFSAGLQTWFAYARAFTFDNTGKLYSVSGTEQRFTISIPAGY